MTAKSTARRRPLRQQAPLASGVWNFARRGWLPVALIVALVACYAPALHGAFVFDDVGFLAPGGLVPVDGAPLHYWTHLDAPDYFPLTLTFYWLQFLCFGAEPFGYHVVSVLLHGIAALCVFRVFQSLGARLPLVIALVFAFHPLQVSSVGWIAEQRNAESMIFCCASLLLFLRGDADKSRPVRTLSLALFLFALLAKQAFVIFPLLLGLSVWYRQGRFGKRDALAIGPFAVLGVSYALFGAWMQQVRAIGGESIDAGPHLLRLANSARVLVFCAAKMIWPAGLSMIYPRWPIDHVEAAAWLAWGMVAAMGIAIAAMPRRLRSVWIFALGWFAICLFPTLGVVRLYYMKYSFVADHWMYAALLGPAFGIAETAAWLARDRPTTNLGRDLGTVLGTRRALLLGVAVLAVLSWQRAAVFATPDRFWRDILASNPDSAAALNGLGGVAYDSGDVEAGVSYFERALARDPNEPAAHRNLALHYARKQDWENARRHYTALERMVPTDSEVQGNLGAIALQLGETEEAIARFEKMREIVPGSAVAHNNLAHAYMAANRRDDAVRSFREAIRLDPGWQLPRAALAAIEKTE